MALEKPLICLDADGVLLDYNEAYAQAWAKAFGTVPSVTSPRAYWAQHRYGLPTLPPDLREQFRRARDTQFWSTMSALPGALQACQALAIRYRLICVTALEGQHRDARIENLRSLGFPLEDVVCTGAEGLGRSPKAAIINDLLPVAFADDFGPYFDGVDPAVHRALITREPEGSPNEPWLSRVHSAHSNLAEFAGYLLAV